MVCRLCLTKSLNTIQIFGYVKVAEYITKFLHLKLVPEDPISDVICEECWKDLENFGDFYKRVIAAQKILSATHKTLEKKVTLSNENSDDEKPYIEFLNTDQKIKKEDLAKEENGAIIFADKFNYFDIVEVHKEEISQHSIITPPESNESHIVDRLTSATRGERKTIPEQYIIKEDPKRKCFSLENLETFQINEDTNDKASIPKRGRPKGIRQAVKVSGSERSAKLWEKSKEFDKIIKESMELLCDLCNVNLIDFRDLQRHFRQLHKTKGYAVCCNRRLYKRAILVNHIRSHEKTLKCKECGNSSATLIALKRHIYDCHKGIRKSVNTISERSAKLWEKSKEFDKIINKSMQLLCDICDVNLIDFRDLQSHFRQFHKTKGYAVCCNRRLYKRAMLVNHIRSHQKTLKRKERGKRSPSMANLKRHVYDCHQRVRSSAGETTETSPDFDWLELHREEKTEPTITSSSETNEQPLLIKIEPKDEDHENSEAVQENAFQSGRTGFGRLREGDEKPKKVISERSAKLWEKSKEFDKIIEKEMKLLCDICSVNLIDFAALQRHFRRVHDQKGYAVCCNTRLYKRRFIVKHISEHNEGSTKIKKRKSKNWVW